MLSKNVKIILTIEMVDLIIWFALLTAFFIGANKLGCIALMIVQFLNYRTTKKNVFREMLKSRDSENNDE